MKPLYDLFFSAITLNLFNKVVFTIVDRHFLSGPTIKKNSKQYY